MTIAEIINESLSRIDILASDMEEDRALSRRVISGIPLMRQTYWDALNTVLDKAGGPVTSSGKLHGQAWMTYAVVRHNFKVQAVLNIAERRIRSQLYIGGGSAKMSLHLLCEQKDAIERDLGYQLGWEERPDSLYSRIVAYLNDVDPRTGRIGRTSISGLQSISTTYIGFSQIALGISAPIRVEVRFNPSM